MIAKSPYEGLENAEWDFPFYHVLLMLTSDYVKFVQYTLLRVLLIYIYRCDNFNLALFNQFAD